MAGTCYFPGPGDDFTSVTAVCNWVAALWDVHRSNLGVTL